MSAMNLHTSKSAGLRNIIHDEIMKEKNMVSIDYFFPVPNGNIFHIISAKAGNI